MSETIQLGFDKSHIITIGEKLYGESLELLREIVSNSYDADATRVWIELTPKYIKIRDDGSGMDESGLREFFNIGSQNKKLNSISPKYKRPRVGQFGIGKFAVLTACERFKIHTQKEGFSAEVVFDKHHWFEQETWQLPMERKIFDPLLGDGTIVTLEKLKKEFTIPEIERYVRERLPLNTPNFQVFINGKRVEPIFIPGKKFPIHIQTSYGDIRGEAILPNFPSKSGTAIGIECVVRGVVICRETFGLTLPIVQKLKGQVSADFVPITSDRTRFITDSVEYQFFARAMQKEIQNISKKVKELENKKEKQKADETLKDTLSRMRKAIRKNPDIAPPVMSRSGEIDEYGTPSEKMSPEISEGEDDWMEAFQSILAPEFSNKSPEENSDSPSEEAPPQKIRVKNLEGKTIVARKIKIGGIGITCSLENCGEDHPPAFTEGGIVYINMDHSLYKKQQEKGQEMLGFYLTYLLAQQVALMLSEDDTRKAFEMQDRLLTDSW